MRDFIRKNYPAAVWIPLLFALQLFYIARTAENVVFRDYFWLIKGGLLDKFFGGTLSFRDIWTSAEMARMPLYHLILAANAALLHLDTRAEMYLSCLSTLLIALIIHFRQKAVFEAAGGGAAARIWLLPAPFILFGLIHWESVIYGHGFVYVFPMLPFLVSFLLFERLLRGEKTAYLPYLFATAAAVSIAFLGGGYCTAFVASLFAVLACDFIRFGPNRTNAKTLFVTAAVSAAALFFYFHGIAANNYFPVTPLGRLVSADRASPLMAAKELLSCLSAGVARVDAVEPGRTAVFIGLAAALFYAYCLRLYFALKMHEKTYLPLFLMSYSALLCANIVLGRLRYGVLAAMASRYTSNTQYALIGSLMIAGCAFLAGRSRKVLAAALVLICAGQAVTDVKELKLSPCRNENFKKLRVMALNPRNYTDKELELFEANNSAEVIDSFEILKKYGLNVYYRRARQPEQAGSSLRAARLVSGWHSWEGQTIWTANTAEADFISGPEGKLVLSGYFPEAFLPNRITLSADGKPLGCYDFPKSGGNVRIEAGGLAPNVPFRLKITVEKALVPTKCGLGADERELGLLVSGIWLR